MTTQTRRRRYTSHSAAIRTSAKRNAAARHHNRKLALALTSNGGTGMGERKARMERARKTVARKQGRRKPKSYAILADVAHDITAWWRGNKGRRRK